MSRFSKRLAYANAIQLLAMLRAPQQQQAPLSFPGFGGLKELLLPLDDTTAWTPEDLRYQQEVLTFHERLREIAGTQYETAVASLKNSTLTSFYTPTSIINPLVTGIHQHQKNIRDILEPAAGTGNFIGPLHDKFPEGALTAIEKDFITARILNTLHPQAEVINDGYENFRNRQLNDKLEIQLTHGATFSIITSLKIKNFRTCSILTIPDYRYCRKDRTFKSTTICTKVTLKSLCATCSNERCWQVLMFLAFR